MYITLSGQLGSGKSTVCNILKEKHGYEVFSTGAIHRRLAAEMGLTTLEFNKELAKSSKIDNMIDAALVRIAGENLDKDVVFDSRLAWHFINTSFKVYLAVDPLVAAERVFSSRRLAEENYASKEETIRGLTERRKMEEERFFRIYGVHCERLENYDLIVDTSHLSPEEVVEKIIEGGMK